jgi:hypothetical protein
MSLIGNGNITIIMNGHLGSSQRTSLDKKKINIEGVPSAISMWVEPLYKAKPTTIFDRKQLVFKQQFANTYGIYIKGPSLKCLKLEKDFEEEDVEKIFGPCITSEEILSFASKKIMTTSPK